MVNTPRFKGAPVDTTEYVVNPAVRLPSWVKCCKCGGPPTAKDWLKPVDGNPNSTRLIHLSHIPDGAALSEEAAWIARNS